jgi:hypothetical protein
MNKDVIYIDVEDDITAIIGKIKASKEKIVALVPPKRIGVLQSAVNLHLLVRMAKNADKQLVLVTNNQALIALSAAAAIPVAKNLQSKPEIAQIPALAMDDDDDIIDGSQLPVGELASTADEPEIGPVTKKRADVNNLVDTLDVDGEAAVAPIVGAATAPVKKPLPPKNTIKVPNFSRFRKRLFLGIVVLVVLIAFIVWANVFAPSATIVITAKTIASPISQTVSLSTGATNVTTDTIQTVTQTLQKTVSVKFTATGSQDLGAKATGSLTLQNAYSSTSIDVPSGSSFTANGLSFLTTQDVTVPAGGLLKGTVVPGTATVNVQASAPGPSYNLSPQAYTSDDVQGITAQGGQMSGGTSNVQTVVSAGDIASATQALDALSTDSDKKTLYAQFKNQEYVIDDTFNVSRAAPVSSPAVGAQSSGVNGATLTSAITYTVSGLARPDIEQFLKSALNQQINGQSDQRIYDDGINNVVLAGYSDDTGTASINIATTGQVGPNINDQSVIKQSEGEKSGVVQQQLESIDGISDAEVKFPYFWVTTVPNDPSKVDVQFKLTNG